jgi:hypothetical protein
VGVAQLVEHRAVASLRSAILKIPRHFQRTNHAFITREPISK